MFIGGAWILDRWGVEGWGRKSYLGEAEIASFASRDFSRSNKFDTFWHVVTTGYFYVLFLWTIAVSDFCLLEIYKNLGFLLSIITLTYHSHADNHFYNLFLNIMQFEIRFFIKIHVRFWPRLFICKFDLNVKHRSYFLYYEWWFFFAVDYVKNIELHIAHTWHHM